MNALHFAILFAVLALAVASPPNIFESGSALRPDDLFANKIVGGTESEVGEFPYYGKMR